MRLIQGVFWGLIAAFSVFSASAIKPRQAKKLHIVVSQSHKHCSPFEGMIWWETGAIENIYRIGDKNSATTKLTNLLFHLHEDGVFDCTRPPAQTLNNGNAPAYFTPEIIAEFIGLLNSLKNIEQIDTFKKKINKDFIHKFLVDHKNVFPNNGNYIKNLEKIFRLICDSHKECLANNPQAIWMPNTTHGILLGYLWKKSTTKQDFISYLKKLRSLDVKVIDPLYTDSFENIVSEEYDLVELENCVNAINHKNIDEIINNYELSICSLLAARPFEFVSHASGVQYKNQTFPDCGEVSLLNFINFLIFNPTTKRFDLGLLGKGTTIHPKLRSFYEKYYLIEDMQTKEVHNAWAEVVSEILGVKYRQGGNEFDVNDNNHYCNIAGIGYEQILTVLKHILGINSFDQLVQVCSRDGFKLTCEFEKPLSEKFNTIIFSVNDEKSLEWQCTFGHYSLKRLAKSSCTQLLSIKLITEFTKNIHRDPARSLLMMTQSLSVMQELIKDHNLNLSAFNFASLIPKIKNADNNCDFIQLLFENYQSCHGKDYIAELIKKLYLQLPDDWQYTRSISCAIVKHKVEKLYPFMKKEIKKRSSERDPILYDVCKHIVLTENTSLDELFEDLFNNKGLIITNFIEFVIDPEKQLKSIDTTHWCNVIWRNLPRLEMYNQKRLCESIIHYKLTDWYPFIMHHLDQFDWAGYDSNSEHAAFGSNRFNPNTHYNPQDAFNILLDSEEVTIKQWLMKSFNLMNENNKQKALKQFSNMPEWNTWVQDNFHLLKRGERSYLKRPLDYTALKLLIIKNNNNINDFIVNTMKNMPSFHLFLTFKFIIKNNHEQLFKLLDECFPKLDANLQTGICESIVLYNQICFYPLIEKWLLSADDSQRVSLLNVITSLRYRYENGLIRNTPAEEKRFSFILHGKQAKKGELMVSENDAKWYPLVEYWLPKLPDWTASFIIQNIEKNNISLLLEIAKQRKALLKVTP